MRQQQRVLRPLLLFPSDAERWAKKTPMVAAAAATSAAAGAAEAAGAASAGSFGWRKDSAAARAHWTSAAVAPAAAAAAAAPAASGAEAGRTGRVWGCTLVNGSDPERSNDDCAGGAERPGRSERPRLPWRPERFGGGHGFAV